MKDNTQAATVAGELMDTPLSHARAIGLAGGATVAMNGQRVEHKKAEFRAAEVLHGWALAGEDFKISRSDFVSAVEAAKVADKRGQYVPHAAALANSAGKGV